MADYTPSEIVDILLKECLQNYREASRGYRNHYPERKHPNHSTRNLSERKTRQGHLRRYREHRVYNNEDDVRVLIILAIEWRYISRYSIEIISNNFINRKICKEHSRINICVRPLLVSDSDFYMLVGIDLKLNIPKD